MAIQMRRGLRKDFDPNKMLPGEWAVSIDATTSNQIVWMCFAAGVCKRMGTYEDFQSMVNEISADIIAQYKAEFNVILSEVQALSDAVESDKDSVATMHTQIRDEYLPQIANAYEYALLSKSYAVGGTGKRENEDSDNAKYYYQQTKQISQGLNGIVPMGTVTFATLPTENIVKNAMYNVSDAFTSDERFNDGGGIYYGPGNNVIWTAEGKWDVTASSNVTGIKGDAEDTYRQGNVNITAENIGLGNVKKTYGTTDISNIADGTLTGAVSKANSDIKYIVNSIGTYINPASVSDLRTIGRGIYLFNGWATSYTSHKPFDNAWGIWIKTGDESAGGVYEIVIHLDSGEIYKSHNYGDFTVL